MSRLIVWLCLWFGPLAMLGGCHYSEEDSWNACCMLHVIRDEAPNPPGRKVIRNWQSRTLFGGDGSASDATDSNVPGMSSKYLPGTWKRGRIESEVADYQTRNPGAPATAYFAELGMTCRSATVSQAEGIRCAIDMPVWVQCWAMNFFPGGPPVPKELRKPLPAVLHVSVEMSGSTIHEPHTQVLPLPGGRLCHR